MLRLLTAAMLANLLTTLPAGADAKGASSMTLSLTSPGLGRAALGTRQWLLRRQQQLTSSRFSLVVPSPLVTMMSAPVGSGMGVLGRATRPG